MKNDMNHVFDYVSKSANKNGTKKDCLKRDSLNYNLKTV